MPRFDGSYPDFGMEYLPDGNVPSQTIPQVEVDFVALPNGPLDGATPQVTNGTRSLDPVPFIDLVAEISGGVDAAVNDSGFGYSSSPMGVTCQGLQVVSGGSGASVEVASLPSGAWVEIRLVDETLTGFAGKLDSTSLSILKYDGGTVTTLISTEASFTSSSDLMFLWDGSGRFKASWGSQQVSQTDDSQNVLGNRICLMARSTSVKTMVAGSALSLTGLDEISAAYRGVIFGDVLLYDGGDFPWPVNEATPLSGFDDSIFDAAIGTLTGLNIVPIVTLAYSPSDYFVDATPGGAPDPSYHSVIANAWGTLAANYPSLTRFVVWKDNYGMRCGVDSGSSSYLATPLCVGDEWDFPRYLDLYNAAFSSLKSASSGALVYGPNIQLAAREEGYDAFYGGVMIDSRDMDFLESFFEAIHAATPLASTDGIALSGSFTVQEWALLLPYLKEMCGQLPLIITSAPQGATPIQSDVDDFLFVANNELDSGDIVFVNSTGLVFNNPRLTLNEYDWVFTVTLTTPNVMQNAKLKVMAISDKVLTNGVISIESDHATPYYKVRDLPSGNEFIDLGNLPGAVYSISIFGDTGIGGNAMLRIGIYSDNFEVVSIADTKYLGI